MDSSKISSLKLPALEASQFAQSNRGHRGGVISMHRALNHLKLGPGEVVNSVALVLFALIVWLTNLRRACKFWNYILSKGLKYLPLRASLSISEHTIGRFLRFGVPHLKIEPILPTFQVWGYTFLATILLFAITLMLSSKWTPITYLLRGVLIIQGTALLYFAIIPARFPHTPDSYLEGLIISGIGLISIIPFLFGITYYIFEISAVKKILLTLFAMAYLAVFLPFQVLLQVLVLQTSVLFMPLLYVVFGMPLDVILIISIYSYGMTWQNYSRT